MSILHLVNDPETTIEKVSKLLKPGGIFITSTACIKDSMSWFGYVAAIGHRLGIMPKLQVFSRQELESMLLKAGFNIDYRLETEEKSDAHFMVATKPL